MSVSNKPLTPPTGPVPQPTPPIRPTAPTPPPPQLAERAAPSPVVERPPAPPPAPPSAIPSEGEVQRAEARIDAAPPRLIRQHASEVPRPLGLPVLTSKSTAERVAPVTTRAFTREEMGKKLIGPNFVGLAKELRGTWFFKGNVLDRATAQAAQIAKNTPPGSDLMHTLVHTSDKDLREMVTLGIVQSRKDKYADTTKYDELSPNKKRLVDAIVKGLREGLPTVEQAARVNARGEGADVNQMQRHAGLMAELQGARGKIRPPSAETLAALDKKAGKSIEQARGIIKTNHEALRTQLAYANLPRADESQLSLSTLGDDKIRGLSPSDASLATKAEGLIKGLPAASKDKMLWTLAMRPFGDTCNSVASRLYPGVDRLSDAQHAEVGKVALALVQASLKEIGPASRNTLVKSDSSGNPKTVEINGKKYEQVKQLGKGGFGVAFLFRAVDKNPDGSRDEVVVKKFMRKDKSEESWFGAMQDEIRAHRYAMGPQGTGHENMLNLRGVIVRPPGDGEQFGEFFTVTEAAKGGEMRDLMGKMHQQLQDKRISRTVHDLLGRQLFAQTVEGMEYVQKQRQMIHLDLKPENLFMTSEGTVKVADFGLANIGHQTHGAGGTGLYMSPEVASGFVSDRSKRVSNDLDYHADTWTLGVIGRELFTGQVHMPTHREGMNEFGEWVESRPTDDTVAFASDRGNQIYNKSADKRQGLQALGGYHQLINAMLHPDPSQRPTLEAVRGHEFVADPILAAPQLRTMMQLIMKSTDGMSSAQLKAHNAEIARLNTEIEQLAMH